MLYLLSFQPPNRFLGRDETLPEGRCWFMQDCVRGLPTSKTSGGPSHFPLTLGSPLPGGW